jgi:hypothetical protein
MLRLLVNLQDPDLEALLLCLQDSFSHLKSRDKISLIKRSLRWLELSDPAEYSYTSRLPSVDMTVRDTSVFPQPTSGMSARQFRAWTLCQEAEAQSKLNSDHRFALESSQQTNSDNSQTRSVTPAAIAGVTRNVECTRQKL